MLAGFLTYPLLGENGTGTWTNDLGHGKLEHTVLTVFGVHNGWLAATPLLAAIAAAVVCALLALRGRGSGRSEADWLRFSPGASSRSPVRRSPGIRSRQSTAIPPL